MTNIYKAVSMIWIPTNIFSREDTVARGEVLPEGGIGPPDEDDGGEDDELREVLDHVLVRPHLRLKGLHLLQRLLRSLYINNQSVKPSSTN